MTASPVLLLNPLISLGSIRLVHRENSGQTSSETVADGPLSVEPNGRFP